MFWQPFFPLGQLFWIFSILKTKSFQCPPHLGFLSAQSLNEIEYQAGRSGCQRNWGAAVSFVA